MVGWDGSVGWRLVGSACWLVGVVRFDLDGQFVVGWLVGQFAVGGVRFVGWWLGEVFRLIGWVVRLAGLRFGLLVVR